MLPGFCGVYCWFLPPDLKSVVLADAVPPLHALSVERLVSYLRASASMSSIDESSSSMSFSQSFASDMPQKTRNERISSGPRSLMFASS